MPDAGRETTHGPDCHRREGGTYCDCGAAGREATPTKGWRVECRACGAWLSTHLMGDVQVWLSEHDHGSPPARELP